MTVGDLIERLSRYPADYEVRVESCDCSSEWIVDAAKIEAGGYVELGV